MWPGVHCARYSSVAVRRVFSPPTPLVPCLRALHGACLSRRSWKLRWRPIRPVPNSGASLTSAAAGVNRLSLGIQSLDDTALAALGRRHDAAQARAAVAAASAAGFQRLNLDLMHGLPGQSASAALDSLREALAMATEHLSWYQLTLEPGTPFHRRPPPLPGDDEIAAVQERGEALLVAAGLLRYEISAFARPGGEARHNLNYWHFGDYLGIGAGAHGKHSDSGFVRRSERPPRPRRLSAPPSGSRVGAARRRVAAGNT